MGVRKTHDPRQRTQYGERGAGVGVGTGVGLGVAVEIGVGVIS